MLWYRARSFHTTRLLVELRSLLRREDGQDLIEYALLVSFMVIAVAVVLPPSIMPTVSRIFSSVASLFSRASATG